MGLLPTGYVSRGVRAPVSLLTRYDASRSVSDPAANRKWPSGSRLKALGRASVETCPMAVNRPEDASTEKPAMLLWPRLGAYKNARRETSEFGSRCCFARNRGAGWRWSGRRSGCRGRGRSGTR